MKSLSVFCIFALAGLSAEGAVQVTVCEPVNLRPLPH